MVINLVRTGRILTAALCAISASGIALAAGGKNIASTHFDLSVSKFEGHNVWVERTPLQIGSNKAVSVENGSYLSNGYVMYSQDPQFSSVNGVSFYDYLDQNYRTERGDPAYGMNSVMRVCDMHLNGELFVVQEITAKNLLGSEFDNRCVNNELIRDFWAEFDGISS